MEINRVFSFGFHDTTITDIQVLQDRVIFTFRDGLYLLDETGREKSLSLPIEMHIYIDTSFASSSLDFIEVRAVGRRETSFPDCERVFDSGTLVGAEVGNLFYSAFNSTLLFDLTKGRGWFLLEISNCLDVVYKYIE